MKRHFHFLCIVISTLAPAICSAEPPTLGPPLTVFSKLKDGDLVFIKSSTSRAEPIEKLTGSPLTHCGLIFLEPDGKQTKRVVYEGAGRNEAHYVTIEDWQIEESTKKAEPGHSPNPPDSPLHSVYARRLKTPLSNEELALVKTKAAKLHATRYDHAFQLGNKESETKDYVYCSELIYEAFNRKIGEPQPFSFYYKQPGLTEKQVKDLMDPLLNQESAQKLRTPPGKYRPDELVISPADVYFSKLLQDVTDQTPD